LISAFCFPFPVTPATNTPLCFGLHLLLQALVNRRREHLRRSKESELAPEDYPALSKGLTKANLAPNKADATKANIKNVRYHRRNGLGMITGLYSAWFGQVGPNLKLDLPKSLVKRTNAWKSKTCDNGRMVVFLAELHTVAYLISNRYSSKKLRKGYL